MPTRSSMPNDFANAWIQAWNSHDLEKILSFYREDVRFSSPLLAKVSPHTDGVVLGIGGLRSYWGRVLINHPGLWFKLVDVMSGVNRMVVQYQRFDGLMCAESFQFDTGGKVIDSHAHESR